jgi:hypothetical protein
MRALLAAFLLTAPLTSATAATTATAATAQAPAGVIAYTRGDTVYVAGIDGTGERAFATGTAPALGGGSIAYAQRSGGAAQLVVVPLDGSAPPFRPTALPDREAEFGPGRYGVTGATWSPDAAWIAVRLMEGSTTTLAVVRPDGTTFRRFDFGHLYGSAIAWRDGTTLAVGTDEGLKLVDVDGTVTALAGAAPTDVPAVWLDASRLVVNGADGIDVVAGGTRTRLLAGARAWDRASDGVLYTDDRSVGIVPPDGGERSALAALPAGADVVAGSAATFEPLIELGDAVYAVSRNGGGAIGHALGHHGALAASQTGGLRKVADGSGLAVTTGATVDQVVPPGATPAAPGGGPLPAQAQPLANSGTGPDDVRADRNSVVETLPRAFVTKPATLLVNALLALLLLVLVTFPAELFNSTLEEHYDEVRGWFGRHGPRKEPAERSRAFRLGTFAAYVAGAALLYCLLDPHAGFDGATVRLYLGVAAGLAVITGAFAAAPALYVRRALGERGVLRVLPGTLAVAVACVAVSRVTKFQPGYLYGIVAGFAFGRSFTREEDGRRSAAGSVAVLAASVVAWLLWVPLSRAAHPGLVQTVAETALATVALGGLVGLVVGLLPVRPLPGAPLAAWSKPVWAVLYGAVLFVFVHVLLHPATGFGGDAKPVPFVTWFALFAAFGAVSVAFWAYFERRPVRE